MSSSALSPGCTVPPVVTHHSNVLLRVSCAAKRMCQYFVFRAVESVLMCASILTLPVHPPASSHRRGPRRSPFSPALPVSLSPSTTRPVRAAMSAPSYRQRAESAGSSDAKEIPARQPPMWSSAASGANQAGAAPGAGRLTSPFLGPAALAVSRSRPESLILRTPSPGVSGASGSPEGPDRPGQSAASAATPGAVVAPAPVAASHALRPRGQPPARLAPRTAETGSFAAGAGIAIGASSSSSASSASASASSFPAVGVSAAVSAATPTSASSASTAAPRPTASASSFAPILGSAWAGATAAGSSAVGGPSVYGTRGAGALQPALGPQPQAGPAFPRTHSGVSMAGPLVPSASSTSASAAAAAAGPAGQVGTPALGPVGDGTGGVGPGGAGAGAGTGAGAGPAGDGLAPSAATITGDPRKDRELRALVKRFGAHDKIIAIKKRHLKTVLRRARAGRDDFPDPPRLAGLSHEVRYAHRESSSVPASEYRMHPLTLTFQPAVVEQSFVASPMYALFRDLLWGRVVVLVLLTWVLANAIAASAVTIEGANISYRWSLAGVSTIIAAAVLLNWRGLFQKFYVYVLWLCLLGAGMSKTSVITNNGSLGLGLYLVFCCIAMRGMFIPTLLIGLWDLAFFNLWHRAIFESQITDVELAKINLLELLVMAALASITYLYEKALRQRYMLQKVYQEEQENTRAILNNIFPPYINQILLERADDGANDVVAQSISSVSVLFCDVLDFKDLLDAVRPQTIVVVLDAIWSVFDQLCEKHMVQKLETVGKTFMACGGLPFTRSRHELACTELALEMLAVCKECSLNIRVGVNTGA